MRAKNISADMSVVVATAALMTGVAVVAMAMTKMSLDSSGMASGGDGTGNHDFSKTETMTDAAAAPMVVCDKSSNNNKQTTTMEEPTNACIATGLEEERIPSGTTVSESPPVPQSSGFWEEEISDASSSAALLLLGRIRANQRLIHSVLSYWFGRYSSPTVALKQLWMISQQNVALQQTVDREIAAQFGGLLLELASSSFSVPARTDNKKESFVPVLDSASTAAAQAPPTTTESEKKEAAHETTPNNKPPGMSRWHEWCHGAHGNDDDAHDRAFLYGHSGKVAAIIVLDQFSRHIHRLLLTNSDNNDKNLKKSTENTVQHRNLLLLQQSIPKQSVLDALAYRTAVLLTEDLSQNGGGHQMMMLTIPMRIFALMPYRHVATVASVQWTRDQIETLTVDQTQCASMIAAFRKATHRRLAVLQDEARRTGGHKEHGPNEMDETTPDNMSRDKHILECGPFLADVTHAADHIVYRTIRDFLIKEGILNDNSAPSRSSKRDPEISSSQRGPPICPIVLSLSGGVDSMVIGAVLAHLQNQNSDVALHLVAVHIDYANRPESSAEASYVERYCQEYWPQVQFRCRRIDEVTRGITARDDYERIAREIRYSFYRDAVKEALADVGPTNLSSKNVGVVLGHHRGDLRENVLSNAHKGCGPLDLSGMTATSFNDGVTLFRPLLPLEKTAIFDYAHKFGIPYFKDTTPQWSTRGKLRNKLLPLLEEIYGEGSMNNLSNLAVESDECRALLHKLVIQPFMSCVTYKPMGISFPTAPWRDQGVYFWNCLLREALHSAGFGMFSDKSVESFLKRACPRSSNIRQGWLQCRKDYAVFLQADGHVYILYPDSFPWRAPANYNGLKHRVGYGFENASNVGPWQISAEVVCRSDSIEWRENDIQSLIRRKVFLSMDSFMVGVFEYYLNVPSVRENEAPHPLVMRTFTKQSRPIAWRGIDTKIQEFIPLLGVDENSPESFVELVESDTETLEDSVLSHRNATVNCVKVTLRLAGNSCPSMRRGP